MRRIVLTAILAASFIAVSDAQAEDLSPLRQEMENKKKDAEALDKQYQSILERTSKNAEPVKIDPWSNMRAPDDPKAKKKQ